jgi:hypothetical protein
MSKGQRRSNREAKKPKQVKPESGAALASPLAPSTGKVVCPFAGKTGPMLEMAGVTPQARHWLRMPGMVQQIQTR